ncbi:MAG TPA: tetratricopeptide repeat protein [Pirellulales bacterium]
MNTWNPLANELFMQAREIASPDDQQEFLSGACNGDAGLRAEVEGLLRASHQAGSFLEFPASTAYLAGTLEQPIVEQAGMAIGNYKLLEQIGEGGFGVVFMAEQQQPVRRKVALKVLKPGMDSRQIIARFEAERQALALMDHPHIAHVFDGGTTDTGRPYFVMELVRGVPITEFCDHGRFSIRQRLELFVDVCQAVQHAHQKGIIHRDIKPTNVMVTLHDGQPVVKVIDFGIAKAMGQQLTEKTLFTNFAQMIGTPLYMSPEQAQMSAVDIDTRGDIYSLGVLLYELLTGTTPFENERLKQVGYDEMRRIIREEEPPKPSTRISTVDRAAAVTCQKRQGDPHKLRRLFRGELDWLVMKALEKDRNRRYETANAFALDVQRFLNDEAVLACPPSAAYRLSKSIRRNKASVGMAALALVFLVLMGSGIGWVVRDRAARESRLATEAASRRAKLNLEVEHMLDDASKAHEESLTLTDNPRELQDLVYKVDYILQRAKGLAVQEENAVEPVVRERIEWLETCLSALRRDARMLNELEETRLRPAESRNGEMWDWNAAESRYAAAFAAYGLSPALEPSDAAAQVRQSSIREALLGGLDAWLQLSKEQPAPVLASIPLRDQPFPSPPRPALDRVRAWLRAVADSADDNAWRKAVREAVMAGDAKELQLLASDAETLLQPQHVLARLGSMLDAAGLTGEAETVLRQAQERYASDFWINYNLGHLLIFGAPPRADEAVGYFRAAVAVRPRSAEACSILGLALHIQGDNDRAIAEYEKAISLDNRFAIAHNNLGAALRVKGRLDEAIAEHREALRLHRDFPDAHYLLGLALYEKQQIEESIEEFSKCLETDPNNVGAWLYRARAYWKVQQGEKAFADYNKAFELEPKNGLIRMERDGQQRERLDATIAASRLAIKLAPNSVLLRRGLGDALLRRGRLDDAADAYRAAIELDPESASARCGLGIALRRQANTEQAIVSLRKAIELDANLVSARYELAAALAQQGKRDDAIAELRATIEMKPTDSFAHYRLALLLLTGADTNLCGASEAVQLAQKSVDLDARNGLRWLALGLAHYRAGKWNEAVRDAAKSMELRSGRADFARFGLAMANWQLGNRAEARQWYESAVQLREHRHRDETQRFHVEAAELLGIDDDAVRASRARLHVRQERWDEAIKDYAAMSDLLSREEQESRFEYACLRLMLDDRDGYRTMCVEMADRDGSTSDPGTSYVLARACAISREPVVAMDRLLRWAEQAAPAGTHLPWPLHTLGLAYYRAGHFERAVEALQRSRDSGWEDNGTGALNELVLAMAHHRLGQTAIAQAWFEQAQRRIQSINAAEKPVKMPAPDWLEIQVLLPEAEGLFNKPARQTES